MGVAKDSLTLHMVVSDLLLAPSAYSTQHRKRGALLSQFLLSEIMKTARQFNIWHVTDLRVQYNSLHVWAFPIPTAQINFMSIDVAVSEKSASNRQ